MFGFYFSPTMWTVIKKKKGFYTLVPKIKYAMY